MSKTPRDIERLFAAADPAADLDLSAPLAAVRERLAAMPDAPPRRRGGLVRLRGARLGLVAAIASAIAVATALLPGRDHDSSLGAIPLPVQAFADELSGPGILHVVTERAALDVVPGSAVRLPPTRTEGWYALDGSAWRTRRAWTRSDYVEQVFDGRRLREFSTACGLLRPGLSSPAARISPLPALPPTPVDETTWPAGTPSPGELLLDLDRELVRGGVRVLGQTTVGGEPAYEVAYGPGLGRLDWHLFVSADRAALLQIDAPDWPQPLLGTRARSHVPTFEILPATPRNAQLLRPAREFRGGATC